MSFAAFPAPAAKRIAVGAIRWDGWFDGNPWEKNLAPSEWRDRLPFYAKSLPDGRVEVRSDSQAAMDREIGYASAVGIDYWAFCYYHPKSWPGADAYNYGLRLYLRSRRKRRLGFCLLLQGQHLGPAEEWPETVARFDSLFKERTYWKASGGRPLVYVYGCEAIASRFGSVEKAKRAFDFWRAERRKSGLKPPYIVAQVYGAEDGLHAVKDYGFDAIGAYSAHGGGDHRERPYSDLAAANRELWDRFAATGERVIPAVNAGWDGRPRLADPKTASYYQGPWYRMPTPDELARHVRDALEWVRLHPRSAEAKTVLIYAWNESDEGGWLVPTLSEGSARLDALRALLRPPRRSSLDARKRRLEDRAASPIPSR